MTRSGRLVAATAVVALALVWASPVAAADPVTFGKPSADSTYGQSVQFEQPVDLSSAPDRVELLLRTPSSVGPGVIDVDPPTRAGDQTLHFALELADGHIVPNTTFTAQWRVVDANGKAWVGPEISETYSDSRVDWRTLEGDVVRVHWYDGSDDFGRRALTIGDDAVAEVSQLLGVTETEPIDFFIYADQDKFYDALGPATRENVGGEAHADIRTLFALITPGEINDNWVNVVVPHELTHLVFDTATDNPYHDPPHWLNEGLAVYLSEGLTSGDRSLVDNAARDGTIMPLEGLVGAFPTTRDRFFLAYAESVSAVDDIVADHGRDALIGLIRSYADGVSDDEAFSAALGVDFGGFERSWLDGLGAAAPVRHGPQPAPGGPLPEGWSGAAPNATIQPGATGAPPPAATPRTNSPIDQAEPAGVLPWLAAGAIIVAIVIGSVALMRSRQQRAARDLAAARATAAAGYDSTRDAQHVAAANPGFSLPADPEVAADDAPPSPSPSGSPWAGPSAAEAGPAPLADPVADVPPDPASGAGQPPPTPPEP